MLSQVQESRGGYTCIRLQYLPFESVGKANELELLNIHIYSIAQSNHELNNKVSTYQICILLHHGTIAYRSRLCFLLFFFFSFLSGERLSSLKQTKILSDVHRDCIVHLNQPIHLLNKLYDCPCMQQTIIVFGEDIQISVHLYSSCDVCIMYCKWHVNVEFVLMTSSILHQF